VGKHETSYPRIERDLYPTREPWVVEALAQHIDLFGAIVWECAAGTGEMAEAFKAAGARQSFCSDIVNRGYPLTVFDFLCGDKPKLPRIDIIATNPPGGLRNKVAERFVEVGLQHIADGTTFALALFLPVDFDSGVTRRKFFDECPQFVGKIVLTRRIIWFQRHDGKREGPKENHAWFLWNRRLLRIQQPAIIRYGPCAGGRHDA
jgi:hypothetical protein